MEALDKALTDKKKTTTTRFVFSRDEIHLAIQHIKPTLEANDDVFFWEYDEEGEYKELLTSKEVMSTVIKEIMYFMGNSLLSRHLDRQ